MRGTRGRLLSRLEKLETHSAQAQRRLKVRIGRVVKRLPADFKGERHLAAARELGSRNGLDWVEFEEVSGPDRDAQAARSHGVEYLNVRLLEAAGTRQPGDSQADV